MKEELKKEMDKEMVEILDRWKTISKELKDAPENLKNGRLDCRKCFAAFNTWDPPPAQIPQNPGDFEKMGVIR